MILTTHYRLYVATQLFKGPMFKRHNYILSHDIVWFGPSDSVMINLNLYKNNILIGRSIDSIFISCSMLNGSISVSCVVLRNIYLNRSYNNILCEYGICATRFSLPNNEISKYIAQN